MKTPLKTVSQRNIQLLFFAAAIGLFANGCTTYQAQNSVGSSYWQHSDLTNAVVEATKKADKNANNKDTIIWRLEQGAALRANGQYQDSNKAFDIAQQKIDQYAQEAKVKVAHEAGALLSNQAQLPYRGRSYDGIMLNTYKALNFLALGDTEKTRPEIIRAYQRQQEAVEENKRRIEKLQDEVASNTNSVAIQKAQDDPTFQAQMQGTNYANLNSLKAYADYVNPFTVYLDGLFFMANSADGSDLEHAHKSFERVQGFIGDNNYIKQDLAAVDALMNGKPLTPTTYVIFETGCAPVRSQIRIDIPIIISKVSYVGAAFPTLQFQGNYIPSLTVTVINPVTPDELATSSTNTVTMPSATKVPTELLADMDSIVGLDFKNEMPIIITKTIASTVVKAVGAYAINQGASQQSDLAGLFSKILTAAYQIGVNIADERTWTTLPKEFQFCRFSTPPDRKIVLETPDGTQKIPVSIENGTVNIIYVKSVNAFAPLLVTQMKLK